MLPGRDVACDQLFDPNVESSRGSWQNRARRPDCPADLDAAVLADDVNLLGLTDEDIGGFVGRKYLSASVGNV
jgi:hypothetical protein